MFALTIVLYGLKRFDSPAVAGWLSFAGLAPGLIVSPIAGALLDRIGPARAIAVDMAASAFLIIAFVVADQLHVANAQLLFLIIILFSMTSPFSTAGVRTLLPRMVPMNDLDTANALDTAIYAVVGVLGPALAGAMVGFAGSKLALTLIGLIYVTAACSLGGIRSSQATSASHPPLLRQALEGIVTVVRRPTLRGLAISYALYQASWGILVIAVPVDIMRHFTAATADVITGLLWASVGMIGGASALIAGRVRTAGRERAVMALGMVATALAAWLIASTFGIVGLVLGLLLVGMAAGPIDVGLLTLRQRRTDPTQLGRVLSVSISLNIAGFPIGSALAGILIPWSLTATVALAGLASALAGAAVIALIPTKEGADCSTSRSAQKS